VGLKSAEGENSLTVRLAIAILLTLKH